MATKTDLKRLGSRVDVVDHVEEGGSGRVFVVRSDVDPATPPPTSAELREWTGAGPGDAVVSVELAHNEDIAPSAGFETIDERRYGAAKIVILKRTA